MQLGLEAFLAVSAFVLAILGFGSRIQYNNHKAFIAMKDALQEEISARNASYIELKNYIEKSRDRTRGDISRLDRDISVLQERLNHMPTKENMEDIVKSATIPLQHDVNALTLQLAKLGLYDARDRILKGHETFK